MLYITPPPSTKNRQRTIILKAEPRAKALGKFPFIESFERGISPYLKGLFYQFSNYKNSLDFPIIITEKVDFEEIDESADNIAQRIRRKNFYLKNGFHETGHYTLLSENRFEVVCSGGELRENAFKDLLNILHAHRPEFPNVLI